MNLKTICFLLIILLPFSLLSAQDNTNYVDVKEANESIAKMERANENHTQTIASNNERKAFLENRIQTSATRLVKIQENLDYALETNKELNALNRETQDRETKDRLEASRDELMSVIWILTSEKNTLTNQSVEDNEEVVFLTSDTTRRETIISRNDEKIAPLKQSVSDTEAKINEISSKLDTIIGRLDGLREEVTTATNP